MNQSIILTLLTWTVIGAAAFSVYVIVVFRTGLVYTARHRDGTLKDQIPLSGYATSFALLALSVLLVVGFDYFALRAIGEPVSFLELWAWNYGLFLLIFLYDTIVVDYFVILIWRPGFLQLPDEMNRQSMMKHIKISLFKAPVIVAVISLVATVIAYLTLR